VAIRKTQFPFPPLPPREVTPWPGPGDRQELLERDVNIIRWFIENCLSCRIRKSPLADLLEAYRLADLNGPSKSIESIPHDDCLHLLHASGGFLRLAWAIRGLCGRNALEHVDASFIRDELLGEDNKQREVSRKLPGGIGTLVFAARLVQAGGGRVRINGNQVIGHDIRWTTADGDVVLVERKDRSYQAGLTDTAEGRAMRVVDEIRRSRIPSEPGAARILMVGFQDLVRQSDMDVVDPLYQRTLEREFPEPTRKDLPHAVIVEHFGMEPRTGGEKSNFFSPQPLNWEVPLMDRVGLLLVRAIGAEQHLRD